MLPTMPREDARSMCTSWVTPCSITATRVSCGVTLTRISSVRAMAGGQANLPDGDFEFLQQLYRLRERQSHDTGIASRYSRDEGAGATLDAVGAGLVERLAADAVAPDVGISE